MKCSPYLCGQEITSYTKGNTVFDGYIGSRVREGRREKVVVNEQGKWIRLSELTNVRPIGRLLHEEFDSALAGFVEKLDPEKMKDMPNQDKESLYKAAQEAIGPDAKGNEEEVKKIVDGTLMATAIKAGTDSNSSVVQKYLKEKRERIQKRIREVEAGYSFDNPDDLEVSFSEEPGDDIDAISNAFYDRHEEPLGEGVDDSSFWDAADLADELLLQGKSEEEVITAILEQYNFSADEAADLVATVIEGQMDAVGSMDDMDMDMADDFLVTGENDPYLENDLEDYGVEADFDAAIDDFDQNNNRYDERALYNHITERFAIDKEFAKKTLRESGNVYDSIIVLADHVRERRSTRLTEASPMAFIKNALLGGIKPKVGTMPKTGEQVPYYPKSEVDLKYANGRGVLNQINQVMAAEKITDDSGKPTSPENFLGAVEQGLQSTKMYDEKAKKTVTVADHPAVAGVLKQLAPLIKAAADVGAKVAAGSNATTSKLYNQARTAYA